jgi:molybdopterin-guanine dinucleotide biosynthesis protein A
VTTVVILAAGKGKRVGGNKPLLPWGASTLIESAIERLAPQAYPLIINADPANAEGLVFLDLPLIYDAPSAAGRGPLSGVLTALDQAGARGETFVVTAPSDMPDLPVDMVTQLMEAPEAEVVYFKGARDYPLCARWATALYPRLLAALKRAPDGLAVMRFIDTCQVLTLPVVGDHAFANINTADGKS